MNLEVIPLDLTVDKNLQIYIDNLNKLIENAWVEGGVPRQYLTNAGIEKPLNSPKI